MASRCLAALTLTMVLLAAPAILLLGNGASQRVTTVSGEEPEVSSESYL